MSQRSQQCYQIFLKHLLILKHKWRSFLKTEPKIHQCFNKLRIKDNTNKSLDKLFTQRKFVRAKLKENKYNDEAKPKLEEIKTKLAEKCAKEKVKIIEDKIKGRYLWGLK